MAEANIAHQKSIQQAIGKTDRKRSQHSDWNRLVESRQHRRCDTGKACHGTDTQVKITDRHDDRRSKSDDAEHAHLLRDVQQVASG